MLVCHLDGSLRVVDRGLDLAAVSNNARITEESLHIGFIESRNDVWIESSKTESEILAFAQDREPAQPGLEPLETDLLEKPVVITLGESPLSVVIPLVLLVTLTPPTPVQPIESGHDLHHESSLIFLR